MKQKTSFPGTSAESTSLSDASEAKRPETTAAEAKQEKHAVHDFTKDLKAFDRLLPNLLRSHSGGFVAIKGGRVVDDDTDEFALAERIEREYRDQSVLIRRVSRKDVKDYLPSPESEIT